MFTYSFDPETKEYLYSEEAFLDPLETEVQGRKVYLLPADSTFTEPLTAKEGYAVVWNGTAWEYKENHRQTRDKGGVIIEGSGTAYWMPGDDWQTPARYMTELGPLPEGAMLVKPEKPEELVRKEELEARLSEAQSYLDSTDWYCARYVDTGVEIPADVKAQRQAAREEITALREELAGLKSEPAE